jgi:hypothetical protein
MRLVSYALSVSRRAHVHRQALSTCLRGAMAGIPLRRLTGEREDEPIYSRPAPLAIGSAGRPHRVVGRATRPSIAIPQRPKCTRQE